MLACTLFCHASLLIVMKMCCVMFGSGSQPLFCVLLEHTVCFCLKGAGVPNPTQTLTDFITLTLTLILLKDISTPKTQTSKISKEDFATSVKNNTLLLEVFGRCLPTAQVRVTLPLTLRCFQPRNVQSRQAQVSVRRTHNPYIVEH
jgi:hypothetical protein